MLNNSNTVLNIKKLIMSQVFMLDMLSFEVKFILCASSPLILEGHKDCCLNYARKLIFNKKHFCNL